ncbi:serine/threonine protein kinase US3 [Bovine alphaherpesvirus 5]|uniref:US3 virion serine/threonine protein kinase n=1 Tax=Bovine alphaherpesvirus 5 TaxID=35244 RepID=Q6X202_9ALPH|nr:US3 virion serine/threonine protein kinase [Bovine alphaherpesvirus 5]AAR86171.1 US3 virion serine/threonine protein kinase [Bovine alphaherpesvirus 5]AQM74720.1 serine/threonine protein kinase US3 [Bovine alphaherpesvirus 5]QVY10601.1 US3 virion serine/threonine protein kinase [Bovine alphaherpesvirus 5]UHJ15493.1 US3 virion serine/threonine protein kinase [Bovine alphaherpesvirus 5]
MERAAERLARQRARGLWRPRFACCLAAEPSREPARPERSRSRCGPARLAAEAPADLYSDVSDKGLEVTPPDGTGPLTADGCGSGAAAGDDRAVAAAAEAAPTPAQDASEGESEGESDDGDWGDDGPAGGVSREEAEDAARALNFCIDRRLTPGSEGRVFEATGPAPARERVVLKIGASASTLAEAMMLRTLDHANVVKLKAVLFHRELVCVVLARYREDLHTHLWRINRPLALPTALAVTRAVLRGLAYLHSRRIAHRDVKTENVFLNGPDDVCLGDFGAAHGPITEPRYYGLAGTLETNSPELLARARYDCRTDVWSAGVVAYETLAYPRALFSAPAVSRGEDAAEAAGLGEGDCARQLLRVIRRLAVRAEEFPPSPTDRLTRNFQRHASTRREPRSPYPCLAALRLPRDADHLLHQMLTFDFRARPTATELLEHPAFSAALG